MKVRRETKTAAPETASADARITFRLDAPLAERLTKVVLASKRTTTSVLEECLEEALPQLEKQFSKAA